MTISLAITSLTPRVLFCFAAIFLSGCVGNVQADGDWEEGAAHDQSYQRIIVLGLTADANARCDFELFMRTQLRNDSTDAEASCLLMESSVDITRENIQKIADDYDADAVLTTMLVQREAEGKEGGDRETRGGQYFKAEGSGYGSYRGRYGAYGVPVVYGELRTAPVITSVDGKVTIRSILYATKDGAPIYEVVITAKDLSSRDQGLGAITPSIAQKLRDAGLVH